MYINAFPGLAQKKKKKKKRKDRTVTKNQMWTWGTTWENPIPRYQPTAFYLNIFGRHVLSSREPAWEKQGTSSKGIESD